MSQTQILTPFEINQKVQRIAWQVYEQNIKETEIILAGIEDRGYLLALEIAAILKKISKLSIVLVKVKMDKKNPKDTIEINPNTLDFSNKVIVLIDDVLNSGKVLIYGVNHFLNFKLKKLTTAVLVDRNHKRFPVKADVKGLSLSTSLLENVDVVFGEKGGVFLS